MRPAIFRVLRSPAVFVLACLAAGGAVQADEAEGLAAWENIYKVFSHPRCANCHTGERPMWSGAHYGAPRDHAMNVRRGDGGLGNPAMRCTTCHGKENSAKPHGPPGAEIWLLAPAEMIWFGQTSTTICAQVKDPERNGERTLGEIASHIKADPLVAWGWEPGEGREPAPGSAGETFALLIEWIGEGAPCPAG